MYLSCSWWLWLLFWFCWTQVYDITDRESFDNVKQWLSEIDR